MTRSTPPRSLHHRAGIQLLRLFVPPIGARHHTRYVGRPTLLIVDTALALVMLALLGALIVLRAQPVPEPLQGAATISIGGPTDVPSGTNDFYRMTVTNTGTSAIENAEVLLTYPAGMEGLSATPGAQDRAQTRWSIASLDAGVSRVITLLARARGTAGQTYQLKGRVQYTERNRTFADATVFSYTVTTVGLTLTAGEPGVPILQGATFPVTVTMTGNGTRTLEHLILEVSVPTASTVVHASPDASGSPLQWQNISLPPGATERRTITLRAEQRFSAQDVTARALLPVETGARYELAIARHAVSVAAPASLRDVSTAQENDAVAFAAEARYTSEAGIQFGYGPLPPRVGETTTYRIFWAARVDAATFRNGTVQATLPAHVAWGGAASATAGETPVYDAKLRIVTWAIDPMPQDAQSLTASFDVHLTPTASMAGASPALLSATRLTATNRSGTSTVRDAAAITTALPELSKEEQWVQK